MRVEMPQMGESVVEGTILTWLKKEGDTVDVDEPLVEVSTDKVDTEIPSPVAGRIARILVKEGETVAVGSPLCEIEEAGAVAASAPTPAAGEAVPPTGRPAPPPEAPPSGAGRERPALEPARPAAREEGGGVLSPLVRRLLREYRLDASHIRGTGAGGRITRDDVLAHLERAAAPAPSEGRPATGRLTPPGVREAVGERIEVRPLSHIRKRIAQHMRASLEVAARAWNAIEVDMEPIARLRADVGEEFRRREGFSLTYLPFVARAACDALLAHPVVNASIAPDLSEATYHYYVNLGIAVATDYGLIVPVIKGAESLTVVGLARAIRDLAERAREKKLAPDEVGGSTFSITNPGPFGSYVSLPVINQPNVAILSTEVVEKRVVVVDDMIAVRHRTFLSMSWDHRLLDGADAMRFLSRLKENLETWDFSHEL